jgi:hypothetical protein
MTGRPWPRNGASARAAVPAAASAKPVDATPVVLERLLSDQSAPANARNQTSTERSTCANQRHVEEVRDRKHVRDAGGARQHQQQREHARGDQRGES